MISFTYKYIQSQAENAYTVVLLHGTGGDESCMIERGQSLEENFNLLSPRGKESENGMQRFFRRLDIGIFDVEDLKFRALELTAFIKEASAVHRFNPEKIILLGYSNGANIAGGMILLRPEIFLMAVLMHPMIPFVPEHKVDLKSKRILITSGDNDHTMKAGETIQWIRLLKSYGAIVEQYQHSRGHSITEDELYAVSNFLSPYK